MGQSNWGSARITPITDIHRVEDRAPLKVRGHWLFTQAEL